MVRILMFGDVIGRLGRRAVAAALPTLQQKYRPDLVLANVENLAHGKGVTETTLDDLVQAGVNAFTSGNHIWAKPEGHVLLERERPVLLRPANYPTGVPGRGVALVRVGDSHLLLINLMGRVFMREHLDCPFREADALLEEYRDVPRVGTLVDFHAEATSEKVALGLYLDGRVSAVLGTHTHVPTADAAVLPGGTAYLTDVGMVGGQGTVIGVAKDGPLRWFLTQQPQSWEYPEAGACAVNAVCVTIDTRTQRAVSIESIHTEVEVAG
jgi:hypothetical protein